MVVFEDEDFTDFVEWWPDWVNERLEITSDVEEEVAIVFNRWTGWW